LTLEGSNYIYHHGDFASTLEKSFLVIIAAVDTRSKSKCACSFASLMHGHC